MSQSTLHLQLDAYLSIREALGFQMRAERTLLRDFVNFVESHGADIPIRAYLAVEWACALSARRGPGGAAQRLSMARGFLTYLRATIPETEVPDSALVASFRRPKPYLFTPDQIRTLIQDAKQARPPAAYARIPYPPSLACWPAPDYGSVRRSDSWSRMSGSMANHPVYTFAKPNSTSPGSCLCIRARPTNCATMPICELLCATMVYQTSSCLRARRTASSRCPLALVYDAVSRFRVRAN